MSSGMIGKQINQFRIDSLIGQGGMGAVYRATDQNLNREVAIKVMHANLAVEAQFQARFRREAQSAAKLDHPGIVKIFSFDLVDNQLFLVMELVTGGNLRQYMRAQRSQGALLDLIEVLDLTRQIASALHYAHQQDMVHRDIKPDNILLKTVTDMGTSTKHQAILVDFGLARLAEGNEYSVAGQAVGTYAYMSPEQAHGDKVDSRTDVYALGIVLYEMAVGRLPYQPQTIHEAMRMHGRDPLPRPSELRPGLPADLEKIIYKALAKPPNDRYQSAADFARDIESMQGNISTNPGAPAKPAPVPVQGLGYDDSPGQTMAGSGDSVIELPPGVRRPPVRGEEVGLDRLVIYSQAGQSRSLVIRKPVLIVGRADDADVKLEGRKVSRQHARIEKGFDGRYRIQDLDSANGSYLGSTRLIKNREEVWAPGATVRIGEFWLQIEKEVGLSSTEQALFTNVGQNVTVYNPAIGESGGANGDGADAVDEVSFRDKVKLEIEPRIVKVVAGSQGAMKVTVRNLGERVDRFILTVEDVVYADGSRERFPKEWFRITNDTLRLLPGEHDTTSIEFRPPREYKSLVGEHAFSVRVRGESQNAVSAAEQGVLDIAPFYNFESDLRPKSVKGRGSVALEMRNTGNAPEQFQIEARDREDQINYTFSQHPHFTLEPGESAYITTRVRPRYRPFTGSAIPTQFEIIVRPLSEEVSPQTYNCDLLIRPWLPYWLMGAIAAIFAVCLILTLTIVPQLMRWQQANQTATANAIATEGQITAVAVVTVTAIADEDGDGLNTVEEEEAGTEPDNPDTDGDGLNDGEEIRVFETNPTNRDTDNDTIPDGDEVDETVGGCSTNPLLEDTDRDGITDDQDPDPCLQPTPTPTAFPTVVGSEGDICAGSPIPSRLVGETRGRVEAGGLPNIVRSEPGKSNDRLGSLEPLTEFRIVGGPECDDEDDLRWFRVIGGGLEGWTTEGEGDIYYLEPMPDENEPTPAPAEPAEGGE